jgi:hypothetical protein
VEWVRIREVLIGRADNGNLRAIDLTLSYDVASSLSSTLFGDWMESKQPAWGEVVGDITGLTGKGKASIGGGNYFVYSLKEMSVLKRLREHAANAAMADRAAATIVERNLMRRYFGFTEADENAMVRFYSWPVADVDWDKIEVEDGEEIVGEAVVELERAEEIAEDVQEQDAPLVRQIGDIVKRIGKEAAQKAAAGALKKHGVRWGDIGALQDQEALLAIYTALSEDDV